MTQELSSKIVEIAHARRLSAIGYRLSAIGYRLSAIGYRRIHDMLRPHFPGVNHKRVYRLYSVGNLAVRKREKVKRPANECVPLQLATMVNEVWSMDFGSGSLNTGRRIKCLTVADDFSHECVSIPVDWGISGQYVTRLLDQAAVFRGYPLAVRTDNGPEFTSHAFIGWAQAYGIRHILIEPGRPMQNCYNESFNGKFRDGCLNEQWFETQQQARSAITLWRQDYNEIRPHSSCQRMPPSKFAELHRQRAGDAARSSSIQLNNHRDQFPDFLVMNGTAGGAGQFSHEFNLEAVKLVTERAVTVAQTAGPLLLCIVINGGYITR